MKDQYSLKWRITAIIVAVGNIIFNNLLVRSTSLKDITDQYQVAFVPAPYTFAIWGLIYLSSLAYLVYSLLPRQRRLIVHEGLAKLLIAEAILGITWLLAYTNALIGLSVVIILFMLAIALVSLITAYLAITERNLSRWVMVPPALYAGWLSVASISNISIGLSNMGWRGGFAGEEAWAIIMICIAAVLGVLVTRRFRTVVYALVISWAALGIYVQQRNEYTALPYVAMVVAFLQLVVAAAWAIGWRKQRQVPR